MFIRSRVLITLVAAGLFTGQLHAQTRNTLSLGDAIHQALTFSPRIGASIAAIDVSRAMERQAGFRPNPEVGFVAENIGGTGGYKTADGAELTASLSQKIELGGKRSARLAAAQGQQHVAGRDLTAAQLDLVRDVTIAYGSILAAQENQLLAEQQEKLARDIQRTVSNRVKAARDPLAYQSQADIALATVRLETQQAERNLQVAKSSLGILTGSTSSLQLDTSILMDHVAPQPLETYQAQIANNPDLQRYRALREARAASVRLEQANAVPDPTFSAGVRDLRATGDQAFVAGISIPLSFFNRNQGNIARAQAELKQAESEYQQAELTTQQGVLSNWQNWQTAAQQSKALKTEIIPTAERAVRQTREGYDRGRFSFLEILNAQRTIAEVRGRYIKSLQQQLEARAQLERLTATSLIPTSPSQTGPSQ